MRVAATMLITPLESGSVPPNITATRCGGCKVLRIVTISRRRYVESQLSAEKSGSMKSKEIRYRVLYAEQFRPQPAPTAKAGEKYEMCPVDIGSNQWRLYTV